MATDARVIAQEDIFLGCVVEGWELGFIDLLKPALADRLRSPLVLSA
jgi:hypothetical protein